MKKLLSMFLACVLLLGILPTSAWAADSVEAALGEVDIYNGGYELGYLSINGAVKKQDYTYFMYKSNDGTTKEVPAYCVNPYLKGVPQKVEPGESIKYLAEERSSDPKVVGIISNGYPHRSLGELNLDNKYQAYYATKMALWCYLLSTWDINNLKVAPGLSGSELDIGNRILAAAKDIYKRGTTYNYMLTPKMTATPDHSVAYPVSVEGKDYYQITKQVENLPEEQREQAAQEALDILRAKKEIQEKDAEIDREGKIAGVFCKAYEKAVLLDPTEENVRIWAKCTRMTRDEMEDTVKESRELAEVFRTIADLMERLLPERGTL